MPGYTIHIAVAKEYVKNHKLYNEEELIKGTIAPDMAVDKTTTHFYKENGDVDIEEFFKRYSINDSYYAGWLLHLLVDREFYTNYLNKKERKEEIQAEKLYQDYDILNQEIIEKYELTIPEEIKKYINVKEGELTYIKRETIFEFIYKMAKVKLDNKKK